VSALLPAFPGRPSRLSRLAVTYHCVTCLGPPNSGEVSVCSPLRRQRCCFPCRPPRQPCRFRVSELCILPTFRLSARYLRCLRLKVPVTRYPPRLATSEWSILSRRDSHPHYVTTLPGRTVPPLAGPLQGVLKGLPEHSISGIYRRNGPAPDYSNFTFVLPKQNLL
jgi:hypothetical protein